MSIELVWLWIWVAVVLTMVLAKKFLHDRFRAAGDPLYQPPKCALKRKRVAPRKKSSLDSTQKASLGRLKEPPNFSSTTYGVAQEQELYQEKILLRAPKRMIPRIGIFKNVFKDLKLPVYVPFEFACGYALFQARGYDDQVGTNFESTEEYIKLYNEVFTLIAFHPFESASDALSQMNYVSKSCRLGKGSTGSGTQLQQAKA